MASSPTSRMMLVSWKAEAQLVRVLGGGWLRLAEDARGHLADHAGHQVAVALQPGKSR
jgi:hypothetical protein